MPRGGGGVGMKMLRGAPKYFLALSGGEGSESSKFWLSRVNRIDGLETH